MNKYRIKENPNLEIKLRDYQKEAIDIIKTTDDKNIYSTLYLMKSGNFVEQFKLSADEKNSIRICDGSYYFEKIKDNSCMYDEIEDICNKRNNVVNRRKLDILETQIEVTEGIKDFIENYDKYNKELLDLQNYYSNFNNNELTIKQLEYNKLNKNISIIAA